MVLSKFGKNLKELQDKNLLIRLCDVENIMLVSILLTDVILNREDCSHIKDFLLLQDLQQYIVEKYHSDSKFSEKQKLVQASLMNCFFEIENLDEHNSMVPRREYDKAEEVAKFKKEMTESMRIINNLRLSQNFSNGIKSAELRGEYKGLKNALSIFNKIIDEL